MHFCIRYNTDANFDEKALALARRLFAIYDDEIDSLTLVPTTEGTITVYVDNHALLDSGSGDGIPTISDIRKSVTSRPNQSAG